MKVNIWRRIGAYLIDLVIGLVLIIINSLIYIFVRKSILNIIQTINELLTGNVKENYME